MTAAWRARRGCASGPSAGANVAAALRVAKEAGDAPPRS